MEANRLNRRQILLGALGLAAAAALPVAAEPLAPALTPIPPSNPVLPVLPVTPPKLWAGLLEKRYAVSAIKLENGAVQESSEESWMEPRYAGYARQPLELIGPYPAANGAIFLTNENELRFPVNAGPAFAADAVGIYNEAGERVATLEMGMPLHACPGDQFIASPGFIRHILTLG